MPDKATETTVVPAPKEWTDPGPLGMDEVANMCGYFNGETDLHNGYGCDHPDQEEVEDGQGKCLHCTCPFAYELDPDHPEDAAYMKAHGMSGEETGWMRLYGPILKREVEEP